MRKYTVKLVGDDAGELRLEQNKAEFKGKEFEYDAKFISTDVLLLRINGENHIVRLESSDGVKMELITEAVKYNVTCKNELDLVKEKYISSDNNRFKDKILSPMPGAVVKININEGDELKPGDVMLVLEAMKMENEIKTESDCIVAGIHAQEKSSVNKGQLLVTLSAPKSE
ncbi:MAG TPA: biotin/lipoyl-containing protein [Ignavibacteria bacterium]|nr:biotin/lipoyl-containing protein [Ignavibacteria bacterium]